MTTNTLAHVAAMLAIATRALAAQPDVGVLLAELISLKDRVGNAETRVRVDALHRVWSIALASSAPQIKLTALDLLREPVGSSSDHIRIPAIYAIAEVANSTDETPVKLRALAALAEPLNAGQVPIRDVAIDAVNSIVRGGASSEVAHAAIRALGPPVRSGNNGVRMPAINGIVRAAEAGRSEAAYLDAIDLLTAPLESGAAIGGFEVRMMAIMAIERIGIAAREVGTKAKAMGLLQSYVARSNWEPEARRRAQDAASAIQGSMK